MLRLTKSYCFALEMVRHCLPLVPTEPQFSGRIIEADIDPVSTNSLGIIFRIPEIPPPHRMRADCWVDRRRISGGCLISGFSNSLEPRLFLFRCWLPLEGGIQAANVDGGIKQLGLDDDIIQDLKLAEVTTVRQLERLTEIQVCQIFQPKGPEVMAHPNPTTYIDTITFDKFQRLRNTLDNKGFKLKGGSRTIAKLQASL